jgi:hypothetical protein
VGGTVLDHNELVRYLNSGELQRYSEPIQDELPDNEYETEGAREW